MRDGDAGCWRGGRDETFDGGVSVACGHRGCCPGRQQPGDAAGRTPDATRPSASAGRPRPCRRRRRGGRAGRCGRPAPGRRSACARRSRRGSRCSIVRCRAWLRFSTRGASGRRRPAPGRGPRLRIDAWTAHPCRCPLSAGSGDVGRRAAHVRDRVAQPVQLHVLAVDDVLVGVVEVVVADEARGRDVALAQRQLVAVELASAARAVRWLSRALLFLAGDADAGPRNRVQPGRAIGSPQSRQMP